LVGRLFVLNKFFSSSPNKYGDGDQNPPYIVHNTSNSNRTSAKLSTSTST